MKYDIIFQRKQHYLTTRYREDNHAKRELIVNMNQLKRRIKHQPKNTDLYITKYPNNCIITTIILDFDSEEDKSLAYSDAKQVKDVVEDKGLNCVIISSTKKGFHNYIQVPYRPFQDMGLAKYKRLFPFSYKKYFEHYINYLIDKKESDTYVTLDMTNTSAGLKGNIRVIGSVHPSTNKRCKVVDGEFLPFQPPTDDEFYCLKKAFKVTKLECKEESVNKRISKRNAFKYMKHTNDPVADNDLRELMPSIFGGKTREYDGYVMMQCPFHSDNNPSLKVVKEWFYCLGCGKKGNWYTLKREGYIREPTIKIKELE